MSSSSYGLCTPRTACSSESRGIGDVSAGVVDLRVILSFRRRGYPTPSRCPVIIWIRLDVLEILSSYILIDVTPSAQFGSHEQHLCSSKSRFFLRAPCWHPWHQGCRWKLVSSVLGFLPFPCLHQPTLQHLHHRFLCNCSAVNPTFNIKSQYCYFPKWTCCTASSVHYRRFASSLSQLPHTGPPPHGPLLLLIPLRLFPFPHAVPQFRILARFLFSSFRLVVELSERWRSSSLFECFNPSVSLLSRHMTRNCRCVRIMICFQKGTV